MTPEPEKTSSAEGPMAQRMLQIQQLVPFQLSTRQLAPTPIRCVMDLNQTRSGQFGALPPIIEPTLCKFFFFFCKVIGSCTDLVSKLNTMLGFIQLRSVHEFWLL